MDDLSTLLSIGETLSGVGLLLVAVWALSTDKIRSASSVDREIQLVIDTQAATSRIQAEAIGEKLAESNERLMIPIQAEIAEIRREIQEMKR